MNIEKMQPDRNSGWDTAGGYESFFKPVLDGWNDRGYRIERVGSVIRTVLVGEAHYEKDLQQKQLELIRLLKPEVIVHEFLEGWMYDPAAHGFRRLPYRTFADGETYETDKMPSHILDLSDELQIPVIGGDLTETEYLFAAQIIAFRDPAHYRFSRFGILNKRDDRKFAFTSLSEEVQPFRNSRMELTIRQYPRSVTILGQSHSGLIHREKWLQDFGYIYIDQTTGKG